MSNKRSKTDNGESVGHPLLWAMSNPGKYKVMVRDPPIGISVLQALGALQDADGDIWIDLQLLDNGGIKGCLKGGVATFRTASIAGIYPVE